LTEFQAQLVEG